MILTIENRSNTNYYFPDGGDYRNNLGRPDSYSVSIICDDGKAVIHPKVTLWMGGLIGSQRIPANATYTKKLWLPHWATIDRPGKYTVNVRKSYSIGLENRLFQKDRVFETVSANATTTFSVLPSDFERLGTLINEWGKQLMEMSDSRTDDALDLLEFTKDHRSIIYLAEALERYGRTQASYDERSRTRQIANALSHFNNDYAHHALKREIANKDDDIRLWVADGLSKSPHPEAFTTLMGMKTDKYWFVRLRVVQKLGEIKTAKSIAELRSFVEDENEHVRNQALSFIKINPL